MRMRLQSDCLWDLRVLQKTPKQRKTTQFQMYVNVSIMKKKIDIESATKTMED